MSETSTRSWSGPQSKVFILRFVDGNAAASSGGFRRSSRSLMNCCCSSRSFSFWRLKLAWRFFSSCCGRCLHITSRFSHGTTTRGGPILACIAAKPSSTASTRDPSLCTTETWPSWSSRNFVVACDKSGPWPSPSLAARTPAGGCSGCRTSQKIRHAASKCRLRSTSGRPQSRRTKHNICPLRKASTSEEVASSSSGFSSSSSSSLSLDSAIACAVTDAARG
mmetsp:Transcript_113493/g.270330  ORF Transcript_113493/g.270330 Transcript_113493/m.270330 type:complete len:222 (+) Transcript_113493:311-976(+)